MPAGCGGFCGFAICRRPFCDNLKIRSGIWSVLEGSGGDLEGSGGVVEEMWSDLEGSGGDLEGSGEDLESLGSHLGSHLDH